MIKYEYDVVALNLSDEQKHVLSMNLGNIEQLNSMLKEVINAKASDGWEPLYPFAVPQIWFRRIKTARKIQK